MRHQHIACVVAHPLFSNCGKYRFLLSIEHTTRKKGEVLCVIMQNPSVAGREFADKSVQFLETLIFQKEYAEFSKVSKILIVNQFARIQTKNFKGKSTDIGPENDQYIKNAIQKADSILIAWGKNNPFIERQQAILKMIRVDENKKVLITRKHPSRGSYSNFIMGYTP